MDLLCQPADIKTKDSFFKVLPLYYALFLALKCAIFLQMYPDITAQCVYSAIIYAYPNSWNGFDEDFKADLSVYISQWMVGTKPIPGSWKMWELSILEPPNLPKRDSKTDDIGGKLKAQGRFDLDALVKDRREEESKEAGRRVMAKLESSLGRKFSISAVKMALSGGKFAVSSLISPSSKQANKEFVSSQDGILVSASEEKRIGIAIDQIAALEKKSPSRARIVTQQSKGLSSTVRIQPSLTSPSGSSRLNSPLRSTSPIKPDSLSPPLSPRRSGSLGEFSFQQQQQQRCKTAPTNAKSTFKEAARRRGTVHAIKITKTDEDEVKASAPSRRQQQYDNHKGQQSTSHSVAAASEMHKKAVAGKGKQPVKPASSPVTGKRKVVTCASSGQRRAIETMTTATQLKATQKFMVTPGETSTPVKHKSHSAHPKLAGKSRRASIPAQSKPSKGGESSHPCAATGTTASSAHSPKTNLKSTGELKKMALSFKDRKRAESATLKGPEFERVLFNLYGRSALVQHYLENMKLSHINEKEVVVGRTEIAEEPPRDAICYKDILAESKAVGDKNQELFLRYGTWELWIKIYSCCHFFADITGSRSMLCSLQKRRDKKQVKSTKSE